MSALGTRLARTWTHVGTRFLPFADAATPELPLGRLLRLSLFQVSVGMAVVLLIGTLNRVMIVELGVPAWLVAVMISLPLVFAPFRALVGFRSDTHRSVLGWRRVPYIWMGTLLQFGGFAIMPFALIVLSGDTTGPVVIGQIGAGLAFLLVGAGLHTTQTVGLALATDLAPPHAHPRVVALLCMMLLLGMVGGALSYGALLAHFSQIKLIQVVQGTALATMVLNVIALWKQEPRNPSLTARDRAHPSFGEAWREFSSTPQGTRRLVALGLGTVAFSMQDVLLEPYGGHVLHLTVGTTTILSAVLASGGLGGFGVAARQLGRGADPYRLAAVGTLIGLMAFSAIIFAAPLESLALFAAGTSLIGFGAGLFAHCTLTAAMGTARPGQIGLALGIWGAVQASAAGSAVAAGGLIRDGVSLLAGNGWLGQALAGPATGYSVVYHIEIALLFATLIAVGPLVRRPPVEVRARAGGFGLANFLPIRSVYRGDAMQAGAITGYIDVAQVALYAFWIFFFGLIIYLRKEDKREGYPLISDRADGARLDGWPSLPAPKIFVLPNGDMRMAPREEPPQPEFDAVPVAAWPGAPLQPIGNPMLAGAGPAASALRADVPDLTFETREPRVVPLRVATDHAIDAESPDPVAMEVVGADGAVGGVVTDLWIDRAETVIRYLEVTLVAGPSVLLPMPLAKVDTKGRRIVVQSILGAQFADVPQLADPDQVTLREEDRIAAFYASGNLFAEPRRMEPLL